MTKWQAPGGLGSTLSALLRPRPDLALARRIALHPREELFTSAITVGELVYGAAKAALPNLRIKVELLLDSLPAVSFDEASAITYGERRAVLERFGRTVAEPDLRIASIALTYDMTVVSANRRHFKMIEGLRQENWLG